MGSSRTCSIRTPISVAAGNNVAPAGVIHLAAAAVVVAETNVVVLAAAQFPVLDAVVLACSQTTNPTY